MRALDVPALAGAAPEAELFRKILTEAVFDGHVAEVGGAPARPGAVAELLLLSAGHHCTP